MRLRISIFIALILTACLSIYADDPLITDKDLKDDAASSLGKAEGFSAISRLPAARIVVYDPVSNSFGFVRTSASDKVTAYNVDYLDRQRLALTTQKIRLLVMPYNPQTTHLTLVKTNGKGVEFDPFFSAPAAPAPPAKDDKTKEEDKTPPPDDKNAGPPKENKTTGTKSGTTKSGQKRSGEGSSSNGIQRWDARRRTTAKYFTELFDTAPERADLDRAAAQLAISRLPSTARSSTDPFDVLGEITGYFDSYRDIVRSIQGDIDGVQSNTRCLTRTTTKLEADAGHAFTADAQNVPFSLAFDRSLDEIIGETVRRHHAIRQLVETPPVSCVDGTGKLISFAEQTRQLDIQLDRIHRSFIGVGVFLDKAGDLLNDARSMAHPTVSPEDWKTSVDAYAETLKNLQKFNADVQKSVDDTRKSIDDTLAPHQAMIEALESPAAWIQRRNYPPLGNGESITLTFQRSVIDPKATSQVTIDKQNNELEIRSASTDVMRLSMGIVKSGFRDPTFIAGPDEPKLDKDNNPMKDTNGNVIMQHQIQFKDENNGRTLPAVFIHNYWERRAPNLVPTTRERFLPTLSLGLPLSNSTLFEQVLLGLDWEVIPGVDFNLGAHFGKANRLAEGADKQRLHVGDFVTTDVTKLQSSHYTSGVYVGISVNSDAFTALTGSRKNP